MLLFAFHTSCLLAGAVLSTASHLLAPRSTSRRSRSSLRRPQRNHVPAVARCLAALGIGQVGAVRVGRLLAERGLSLGLMVIRFHACLLNQFIIQFELCLEFYSSD